MTAGPVPVYFAGPIGVCDLCQRPLAGEAGFGDVEVPGTGGAWGLLCLPCCAGAAWGWGFGQRYERQDGCGWVLVEGGPPA